MKQFFVLLRQSKSFPQRWAQGKPLMWNLLQDNAFSHQMSWLLTAFLGSALLHDCHPQPSKPVLCSESTAYAAKPRCSSTLHDNAQQNCMTVAVSRGLMRAQQERQVWVTSLCPSSLRDAADNSWQGQPQRVTHCCVATWASVAYRVDPGHPCQQPFHPGRGCTWLCGAKSRQACSEGIQGPHSTVLTVLYYSMSNNICGERRAVLSSVLRVLLTKQMVSFVLKEMRIY